MPVREANRPMHPIAFKIGALQIHWYGVFLSSAMALGVALYTWLGKRRGYNADFLSDACLWMLAGGLLGARVDAGFHGWERFFVNPFWILDPRQGGFTIHGAIFGGLLAIYLRFRREKVPFLEGMDMGTAVLFPCMALGRIGCLMQGCCYGKMATVPWAITYPGQLSGPRHPVPLYEAGMDLLLWPIVLWVFHRSKRQGQTMFTVLFLYSIIRFTAEFFREGPMWGPLSQTQWGSVAIFCLSLPGLVGVYGGPPRYDPSKGSAPEPRISKGKRKKKER
ncbi:MAG: prolipoprotein diacylglyceryl transferase [Candidatus Eremiobacterota bacterium]